MIATGYLGNELRRRFGRTAVTALGLAAGVGLVMGIIGVSDGLNQAQNQALSPLSTVGTDIIVTRTVGATSAAAPGAAGATPAPGGGSFFSGGASAAGSAAALQQLNAADGAALLNANSTVLTDLSKLGPAGTTFLHDFFVPGTLITFPQAAVSDVSAIPGVQSAVPGLSLQALHETGTVPTITDTFQTGGQTLTTTSTPAPLTNAEKPQVYACFAANGGLPAPGPGGGGSVEANFADALQKCLPARYHQYVAQVLVPAITINRVLNPPATDTQTKTYSAAGVNPANTGSGLIVASQVNSGSWFTDKPANQILVNTAYASANGITVGQVLTINGTAFTVVGLVNPTLTGNISDIYFDLATLQSMASDSARVNEVLVKVGDSSNVDTVATAIKKALPGAQILTAKSLADQVTGSLANARQLASSLGGAVAVIILLAAFLIAALLTTASVAKRVREIGTLRALGWRRGRVVRQIMAETLAIGVAGALLGVLVGVGVCEAVNIFGPTLSSTTSGAAVGASSLGSLFHQSNTASASQSVHLKAIITAGTIMLGIGFALLGGLVAGAFGGWRASRLAPSVALRDLG